MQMDWDMGYTRDLVRQQADRIAELEKRIENLEFVTSWKLYKLERYSRWDEHNTGDIKQAGQGDNPR